MQRDTALPWLALCLTRGIDAVAHQGAMTSNGRAILSAFPLGTHPAPESYPIRNRIMAGMPLGAIIIEGAHSGSLITARLDAKYFPAKFHRCAEDSIKELPTPVRAALTQLEQTEAEQRNLLVAASLTGSGQKIYALRSSDDPPPIDDTVERTGLNSSDVLATLFNREMKGFVRQLPGKQFSKIML